MDLLAADAAAAAEYPLPVVVFDFGTATTVTVVDADRRYRGGVILAGVKLSLHALFSGTAQLPDIALEAPGKVICSVTEARVISDRETMTYTYYQNNVKPKPETEGKHGFVCKVCGWIYEGDTLPDDIVCPLCKHGAADFEPIG